MLRVLGSVDEGQQVAGARPCALAVQRFDARFGAAEVDLDSIKRAGQFIRMNDLVVGEG